MIGENCEIQSEAVVHESILWPEAKVGRGALVEQAVVAGKALVSPGVEVRGSIVLDTALSSAERQSLSGSTDLTPAELNGDNKWWKRWWKGMRPSKEAATNSQ
jgi:NDP-sugar pyrophosphorylase family protein